MQISKRATSGARSRIWRGVMITCAMTHSYMSHWHMTHCHHTDWHVSRSIGAHVTQSHYHARGHRTSLTCLTEYWHTCDWISLTCVLAQSLTDICVSRRVLAHIVLAHIWLNLTNMRIGTHMTESHEHAYRHRVSRKYMSHWVLPHMSLKYMSHGVLAHTWLDFTNMRIGTELIAGNPPPPGGFLCWVVPWSRAVCKRFPDEMRPSHLVGKSLTHGSWSGNIVNR